MNNLWPVIDRLIFIDSASLSYTGIEGCHIDFVYGAAKTEAMTKLLAHYSSTND